MKKDKELMIEVADLYQNTGYGYRKISEHLKETRDISVSYMTVKKWIEQMSIEKHPAYPVKQFSKSWYKKKLEDLKMQYNDLQDKYIKTSSDLDNAQREIEYLNDDLSLLRDQNRELREIAIKAFREGIICKEVFKKVTKII